MNRLPGDKTRHRIATPAARSLFAFAFLLALSALMGQPGDTQDKNREAVWPETAPYNAAIHAFDSALTRAGWDPSFRQRLSSSPNSAKAAVAEEGHIKIPASKIIVFYEPQPPKSDPKKSASAEQSAYLAASLHSESKSNENVHVFYLPPFNQNDKTKQYRYEDYFMCCYDFWRRQ